jgi:hypothetical protein
MLVVTHEPKVAIVCRAILGNGFGVYPEPIIAIVSNAKADCGVGYSIKPILRGIRKPVGIAEKEAGVIVRRSGHWIESMSGPTR